MVTHADAGAVRPGNGKGARAPENNSACPRFRARFRAPRGGMGLDPVWDIDIKELKPDVHFQQGNAMSHEE